MNRIRFGIRLKLLLLSIFLFAIPWLGYQYVWELESYLRTGQEQTMEGTARAVATALHERPSLFDSQSSYLQDVKPGTDLYAHKIVDPIQLDGQLDDWVDYRHLSLRYGEMQLIEQNEFYNPDSFHFEHMVGQYSKYLYAMFEVIDDNLVYRPKNSLRVDRNDYLLIAVTNPQGDFRRYIVAPQQSGWVNAYLLDENPDSLRPLSLETAIQGNWLETETGYNIELRFPLEIMSSKIAFAIADVDDPNTRERKYIIGTANPNKSDSLGTVLVPSPEIEKILKGLKYSNARVWVVDKHMRVLARSGSIQDATGVRTSPKLDKRDTLWHRIEQDWLFPMYYQILTKPPADFVDELENAYALKGQDLAKALTGTASSQWRLSPDNKAVVLSAAHPIFIDEQVMGAVVVEQTTHGIRTLRNRALEQLFHVIIAVVFLGTAALFLFASRISFRISKLRNETESAIDENGKILSNIPRSNTQDEIGDLSRTFHSVLDKLQQYNHYLENMSSRLSHELRTPVAIVKSSLENLSMEQKNGNDEKEKQQYIERAQTGIHRLSKILSNMSEATRLEQAIQYSERESFELSELLIGCTEGYRIAYPQNKFSLNTHGIQKTLNGAPELFAQMLDKVIANAVEFSPDSSTIILSLMEKSGHIELSIANTGPKLPDNMHAQLLNSMVSVREHQVEQEAHLGLGLYIAKIIAEYHKAKIHIQNREDDKGVEVKIQL
ncbi:proteobacterial dedicated sortase system histidine kinase [Aliiglaciecola sp. 3_MG-2023]|uniref:proteobacterial dedicated sortase system histidine kinase n=1 Tax=Aliiglaciecola sp. 3_MG-2023 TaxID=3062644 RepID=UPI0026E416D6|nr:proteobacterial dedicated sortase system histidine kinase [Aliiglaciecola sp. 3_MG-2023]MDO6695842.1 proteobacterial dedicated sortase system histidine kinase [Aliiglaciecola sp. 3_MG-2023]